MHIVYMTDPINSEKKRQQNGLAAALSGTEDTSREVVFVETPVNDKANG
jgi:hypothetical protein